MISLLPPAGHVCAELIDIMANQLRIEMKALINSVHFFSLEFDGSTAQTGLDKELVYGKVVVRIILLSIL